jgi:cephalosporin hydroxylase
MGNPIVAEFTRLYIESAPTTWQNTFWRGVPVAKSPLDLWVYQEIIHECRPDVIIETGTWQGGSARFMADMLDLINPNFSQVFTIDIEQPPPIPSHLVTQIIGDSGDLNTLMKSCSFKEKMAYADVMVVLDSSHTKDHVLKELALYAPLVTPGQYLIVEDTCVNGHPVCAGHGPGPWEALEEWLPSHPEFQPDLSREKFLMTFNPGGFLRRVK